MKLTFVDAGVLIAAARGGNAQAARAMEILDDPERESSPQAFSCVSKFCRKQLSTSGSPKRRSMRLSLHQ